MTERADGTRAGITIRPAGGLGNQLFSYACGYAVSARLGCPLYVDLANLTHQPRSETPRAFELHWLVRPEQLVSGPFRPASSRVVRAARRRIGALASSSEFTERSFAYDDRIERVTPGTTLHGFFQSWRYFASTSDELRRDLLARAPSSQWSEAEGARLAELRPWIAVHVRRGDYTQPKNLRYHGLLSADYYQGAIAALIRQVPEAAVVVFSDDTGQAESILRHVHDVAHFVVAPKNSHAMESVVLMSNADAVVTANSSFSWWGAWLADPTRTPAVAPAPWFRSGTNDESDLCPPQWLRAPS